MEWVRDFASLGRDDLALAGGKGANLGEMARAGLPVPPGFVLTTAAYRSFVAANGLQPEIERLAGAAGGQDAGTAAAERAPAEPAVAEQAPADPAAVEAASAAIRALFDGGAVPAAVAAAVRAAYAELGGGRVAVRSSATAEDLPGASFAGQQETYLNVEGDTALLAAVRRCWSSLWTPRAIAYRARQGIAPGEVALAVAVQRQVEADAAGVLFTANPVSGRRDQMVIDGAWGLGEAVVSGQVTPDHWVVDTGSGAVLEAMVAEKQVMTVRTAAGTETVPVPAAQRQQPCLRPEQVAALAGLGRAVAEHYGTPQDIEWAVAGGRLYLLQARPITALFPLPAPPPPPAAGPRVYICLNNMQGLVEPLTPMGLSVFRVLARSLALVVGFRLPPRAPLPALKVAALRLWADATNALRYPRTRAMLLRALAIIERPTADTLRALLEREPRLSPTGRAPVHPRAAFVLQLIWRIVLALAAPQAVRRRWLTAAARYVDGLERRADALQSPAARLRFAAATAGALFPGLIFRLVPLVVVGIGSRFMAERLLQRWLGETAGLQPVLRSLPHNPTTQMDLDLWRLSRELKAAGAAPAADHPGVEAFLARYGHRAVREIDVGMPRWREDPAHILNVLRTYLSHGEADDPERKFRQGEADAAAAVAALVAQVRQRRGWWRAAVLGFWLRRVRALAGVREYPKFLAVRGFALIRRVLLDLGADLAAAGRLQQAGDVFYVTLDDLAPGVEEGAATGGDTDPAAAPDLPARAAAGRAEYRRELGRRSVPRVLTSEGETLYSPPVTVAGALVGAAASPGVYEGRVRVIHDPAEAKLEPGEVLVAPGTDPAWTPLFFSAGALVMEMGGMMSHGSVVAREYGIPAVVGVPGATQRLRNGQRVRVDGEAGQVVPLD